MVTKKALTIATSKAIGKNNGIKAENATRFTLCGYQNTRHDNRPFDIDSDISEMKISVKSLHFTLASNLNGTTKEEMISDYFKRTASEWIAYTTETNTYIMDMETAKEFFTNFTTLDHDSKTKQITVRGKRCEKAITEWLEAHC